MKDTNLNYLVESSFLNEWKSKYSFYEFKELSNELITDRNALQFSYAQLTCVVMPSKILNYKS